MEEAKERLASVGLAPHKETAAEGIPKSLGMRVTTVPHQLEPRGRAVGPAGSGDEVRRPVADVFRPRGPDLG